jgi:hypothetical protein
MSRVKILAQSTVTATMGPTYCIEKESYNCKKLLFHDTVELIIEGN